MTASVYPASHISGVLTYAFGNLRAGDAAVLAVFVKRGCRREGHEPEDGGNGQEAHLEVRIVRGSVEIVWKYLKC